VHDTVALGANVRIGEFAVVGENVVLGDDCEIAAHAIVRAGCRIGKGVSIDSFAVIGGPAQMRVRTPSTGHVRIGDRTVVREGVTINLPTKENGVTEVGADCLLMANSHIGHDSSLQDGVTLANNVMLAGHVHVGRSAFLGGGAGVHQFVRVGPGAIVGGNASMSYDVAPYVMAVERNEIRGLNVVGLRRMNCATADLADLKRCFHAVFCGTGNVRNRAAEALASGQFGTGNLGRTFLEFFATGKRGFAQVRSHGSPDAESS